MAGSTLPAFVAASLLLAVTPGPGVIYIVTRTLAQGRAAGLASVAGVACGNFVNSAGAALGLAALFAVSSVAFELVRFAGAAYLVGLGVRMLLVRPPAADVSRCPTQQVSLARLVGDGLVVAALNPKTALFFAAFLPQFMDARAPALPQALGLGGAFVAIAATTDAAYALLAHAARPRLARAGGRGRDWLSRAGGVALIGLGVLNAVDAGHRPAA